MGATDPNGGHDVEGAPDLESGAPSVMPRPVPGSTLNPYAKAARFVLRLVGFGLMLISFTLLATDLFLLLAERKTGGPWSWVIKSLPFVAGLVIFWISGSLARRLTRQFDE